MDWLNNILNGIEGITEEQKTAITSGFNSEFPKNAVPKDQYKKKTDELEAVNTKLNESTIKIDELSKSSATIEEYKQQLTNLKTEHDTFKAEIETRDKNTSKIEALKKMLSKDFTEDAVDLLASTYKLDDINLTEKGEVVDAESKIAAQKSARPNLVVTTNTNPNTPKGGDPVVPVTDTSKLTDEEYYASLKKE